MQGRRPIPTKLHLLQGGVKKTHRSKNYRKGELDPPIEIPKCPKHLDKEARKEWKRITKELEPLGLLTKLDRAICASYCQAWSTWVQASDKIREVGMLVKSNMGTPMLSPYLTVAKMANEQMTKALIEIGMSPSSRSRVKATPQPKKDEAEEFLNQDHG